MSDLAVINVITSTGSALIARSLAESKPIVFVRGELGTGEAGTESIPALAARTALVSKYANADITKRANQATTLVISAQFWNTDVQQPVYIREIGLIAKLDGEQDADAILFSYLTFGSHPDLIPEGTATPVQRIYDVPFDFASGSSATVTITPSTLVSEDEVSEGTDAGMIVRRDAEGKIAGDITGDAYSLGGHTYDWYAPAGHTHAAATASQAGFLAANDKAALDLLASRVDQDLTRTATPTFRGLTVDGYIDGARFR
ncbi:MAG: hypothetical protein IKE04_02765 [Oscillospiraceae bacterium]|nr:hypothetical protein [Oscillospiraceae bacterium]